MDLYKGYNHTVTEVSCKYKNTTTFADEIRIVISVEECKGVRLKLLYEMEKADGTCVCVAHSEHCFVDPDGRPINLKKKYPEFYEAIISRKQQLSL